MASVYFLKDRCGYTADPPQPTPGRYAATTIAVLAVALLLAGYVIHFWQRYEAHPDPRAVLPAMPGGES